jgi:hypothetical protein
MKTKIIISAFLLTGCVSQTVKTPTEDSVWKYDTKAQIVDKVKSDSYTVAIEVFAYQKKNYRMEISATLGYQVASVTMNNSIPEDSGVRYASYPHKSFVTGPLQAKVFKPLFKQDLNPSLLIDLIEDRQIKKYGFLCGRQTEMVIKCTNDEFELLLERPISGDTSYMKKITIDNRTFRMVWLFKNKEFFNGYTNDMLNRTFVLEKPEGFKQVDIK